jgi:signal transduction histidine kinase
MSELQHSHEQLADLAAYLRSRRNAILRAWRASVDRDPDLATASTMSRAQFNDHIPDVLDAFGRRLCADGYPEHAQARADEKESAAGHGLHRWQQGYDQSETMREWGHLHLCLLEEIERFGAQHPQLEPVVLPTARQKLVQLCNAGVCESASRYARMQRAEAAGRVRELEQALTALQVLDRQRAESWREAAHDLRGSVTVIASASAILNRADVPDPTRVQISQILRNGVSSLHELLTDLMSLARLEAGQEQRYISGFDAAQMLREFCDTLRPLAAERSLFLKAEGPESLSVQGDAPKIQRILQNLVLNALRATERGGVRVSWQDAGVPGREQWMICVQDTGPGLSEKDAEPVARALRNATEDAHDIEARAQARGDSSGQVETPPALRSQSSGHAGAAQSGEGVGLSIVKRLCELLDASLELESMDGKGTTFRLLFPRHYGNC